MTAKPKTRKAPAAKAAIAPKAAMIEPKPNEAGDAEKLMARWNFLTADAAYKASIAVTEGESEACYRMHDPELDQIADNLSKLSPGTFYDALKLLRFVVRETKDNDLRWDDLELKIIRNVTAALPELRREEAARMRKEGDAKARANLKWTFQTLLEIEDREAERQHARIGA